MDSPMHIAPLAPKPEHVPDDLVVDFDIIADRKFNGRWQDGTAAIFDKVGPIFWTPRTGGHWVVGGYDAVTEMGRRTDLFSSDPQKNPATPDAPRMLPINLDPPEHAAYRVPLASALSPAIVNGMRDSIRNQARDLIAVFGEKGRADAVSQFSEQFPVGVILRLMGLPMERLGEFRTLMRVLLNTPDRDERDRIIDSVGDICAPVVREQMANPDPGMIIGRIVTTGIDGRIPTFDEALGYCRLIFTAGLDTVINALSFGIYHLAKDQELQAQLRADYKLIPQAIEEFLRRYSVVQNFRTVMRDCEFFGAPLRQYDTLLFTTAGANLDPAAYSDPLEIRLGRKERPHQAFLTGPHRCAGFNLARIEMAIAYEEIFNALPPFRLDPEHEVRAGDGFTYCLEALHIIW